MNPGLQEITQSKEGEIAYYINMYLFEYTTQTE
jgi:hypothetical protein